MRVCENKDKNEVCCWTHEEEGEGEGGQWCAMMRVTIVVMLLDVQGQG